MLLALLALAAVAALVVVYQRRVRSVGPSVSRRGGGRLAERVAQSSAEEAAAREAYVDEQAAVWESGLGARSGRPVLFEEDLGRPDPRSPEAYDVSDLYAPVEDLEGQPAPGSMEDAVDDLVAADFGWDMSEAGEGEADRAFAADLDDLDEVDDADEFDRFAPRRSPLESPGDAAGADEFVSELLGTGEVVAGPIAGDIEPASPAPGEPLERRTPKATADSSKQPLRLARTQQRPSGTSRRSPEQMRAMLLNYRGGIKKGREQPRDDSAVDEP